MACLTWVWLSYLGLTVQLCDSTTPGTIYDYRAQVPDEDRCVDFSEFRGKPVLFVNVATYWRYTSQYKGKKRRCALENFLFVLKVSSCLWFLFSHTGI